MAATLDPKPDLYAPSQTVDALDEASSPRLSTLIISSGSQHEDTQQSQPLKASSISNDDDEGKLSRQTSSQLPETPTMPITKEDPLSRHTTGPVFSVFSTRTKYYITFLVAFAAFLSPLSANIYFPALNTLAHDLNVSNTLINLTLTSYMLFQGLAPSFFGELSDMIGRRPCYIIGFTIYIGANAGLALQNSYAALFVLRCLQSTGSSGAVAIGSGVVADIATSAERGKYIGIVQAGSNIGPTLGPVIGGLLAQFLGWRAIFWFLLILAASWLIMFAITFPECGRVVVGNGSIPPTGWNRSLIDLLRPKFQDSQSTTTNDSLPPLKRKVRFPNPLHTLSIVLEKDVALILFYTGIVYSGFYCITATMPALFAAIYGYDSLQVGLCYIPIGVASVVASFTSGRLADWNYARIARKHGFPIDKKRGDDLAAFPIEHARVGIIWPVMLPGVLAYISYGWILEQNGPLAAVLVVQFIISLSFSAAFSILFTLMVDLYPARAATATAANNLVRCWMGAGATAAIASMLDKMGRGWCYTFIGLVCGVCGLLLWVLVKWGPGWREERRVRNLSVEV